MLSLFAKLQCLHAAVVLDWVGIGEGIEEKEEQNFHMVCLICSRNSANPEVCNASLCCLVRVYGGEEWLISCTNSHTIEFGQYITTWPIVARHENQVHEGHSSIACVAESETVWSTSSTVYVPETDRTGDMRVAFIHPASTWSLLVNS